MSEQTKNQVIKDIAIELGILVIVFIIIFFTFQALTQHSSKILSLFLSFAVIYILFIFIRKKEYGDKNNTKRNMHTNT